VYRLEVRRLNEPCLWCWTIYDTLNGHIVASSWGDDWMAYASSREAALAAIRRVIAMERADTVRFSP